MSDTTYGSVSEELDELSSTLMGMALDLAAEGMDPCVLLAIGRSDGSVSSLTLADDDTDALIDGARERIRHTKRAERYAFTYEAAVELDDGSFADAIILEFGERGRPGFSAYSLIEGRGSGDDFRWTDPAPAGEEEALLG